MSSAKPNRVKELRKRTRAYIIEDSIPRGKTARTRLKTLRRIGGKEVRRLVRTTPFSKEELCRPTFFGNYPVPVDENFSKPCPECQGQQIFTAKETKSTKIRLFYLPLIEDSRYAEEGSK